VDSVLVLARHFATKADTLLSSRVIREIARAKVDLPTRGGKNLTVECDLLDRVSKFRPLSGKSSIISTGLTS